jgi:hypothetical protein
VIDRVVLPVRLGGSGASRCPAEPARPGLSVPDRLAVPD